ncbi:hypothetical protein KP806_17505 [Paenibacillus sp. N4]|uniref:hypothetical protein n=1 Tax=Paenibacillus vietnamensis TaxID=2590547 RepID=UPI001CD04FD4|nr:hypothetical protein [Paenibacillus vietnamensis]MCA0756858.1 hypothetical protein [Paenibacillus vietnamensis]
MQLYRMKAEFEGKNRMKEFLEDNYVCFGWHGIGDLEKLDMAGLAAKLAEAFGPAGLPEREWSRRFEELSLFAYGMRDGDYVIVDDGMRIHLGDVGDYYYLDLFDNAEDGSCHRRGVTWLRSLLRDDLHPELLAFLEQDGEIGSFGRSVTEQELERLLAKPALSRQGLIDEETLREALDILKAAMRSEDPERRERAAIAILQAARL